MQLRYSQNKQRDATAESVPTLWLPWVARAELESESDQHITNQYWGLPRRGLLSEVEGKHESDLFEAVGWSCCRKVWICMEKLPLRQKARRQLGKNVASMLSLQKRPAFDILPGDVYFLIAWRWGGGEGFKRVWQLWYVAKWFLMWTCLFTH